MKIGLIDVDGHNFPNLCLMKISAFYKARGVEAEWYDPLLGGHYDKVYMSKVFGTSADYEYYINADEVVTGGTGYCISLQNGREVFDKAKNTPLPAEIEHIMPDYSLYGIKDTAYGFLTRGCPRHCAFCVVGDKEGLTSRKVADLTEWWSGQRKIELLDPNLLACPEAENLLSQLADSGAEVNVNQGMDIRVMTADKARLIERIKTSMIHFAWDRYEDKDLVLPKLKLFREISTMSERNIIVYVLTNFSTTHEQDIERAYTITEMGMTPYVMIYDKAHAPKITKQMARWCNNRFIFRSCPRFEDYRR